MRAMLLVLIACLATPVSAQVYPIEVDGQECLTTGCRKIRWVGSAVAIGRFEPGKEILVTAGHCLGTVGRTNLGIVKPLKTTKAITLRVGIGSEWRTAVIGNIAGQADGDLGLILLTLQPGDTIRAVDIAAANPPVGTPCTLAGYPNGGGFRQKLVRVASYSGSATSLVMDDAAIPGDSGGAILNDAGELVGIISATSERESYATPAETIRRFVSADRGGLPTANGVPLQPPPPQQQQPQFAPPAQPLPQLPPAAPQYTSDPVVTEKLDKLAVLVEGAKIAGQIGTGFATGSILAVVLGFWRIVKLIHTVRTGGSATGPPTTPPAQPGVTLPNGQLAGYAYTVPQYQPTPQVVQQPPSEMARVLEELAALRKQVEAKNAA